MIQLPAEKYCSINPIKIGKSVDRDRPVDDPTRGIKPAYIQSMIERQEKASVYIGNFVALHGTDKDEEVVEEESI